MAAKGRNKPNHPRRAAASMFSGQVMQLRLHGHSFSEIVTALGCSKGGAHKAYMRELVRIRAEVEGSTEAVRALELRRLDLYLSKLAKRVQDGDERAIDRAIKISERRAKLLGLEAPTKIAPTTPDGTKEYAPPAQASTEAVAERVVELIARAQRRKAEQQRKGK